MKEEENYKQFSEDLNTGKNLLLDYHNNEIECTKLGIKKPKYSRNITGLKSYKDRFKNGLINNIKYGPLQYLPISNRFMGSPMYPRPLSIPFNNQKDIKEKSIIDEIKNEELFDIIKNKNLFLKGRNSNNIPSYFCSKLAIDSPKNKNRLIELYQNEI